MVFTILRSRPKLSVLFGTLALAAALVVIPIPYSRTVGHEVTIDVDADRATAEKVERELSRSLHTGETRVHARQGGFRVSARARGASARTASATGDAFVRSLADRGVTSRAQVTPVVARVSGSVYAMARDKVLRLEIDEEATPEEIAESVRLQFEAAGITGEIGVHQVGDTVIVTVNPDDPEQLQRLQLNGTEIDLGELDLPTPDPGSDPAYVQGIRVERTPGMSDEELQRRIQARLAELGISTLEVRVVGGQVTIQQPAAAPSDSPR